MLLVLGLACAASAQDIETEATQGEPWRVWLPFAFTGEQYGFAFGLGGGGQDLIAPGVVSLGAAFVTTNGVVLRVDVAAADEGWTLRALAGHSF